jgi:hypothetical protein
VWARGCIVFVGNVVLNRLGDTLLFCVYVALVDDAEILPEQTLPVEKRPHEFFHEFLLEIHNLKDKLNNIVFIHLLLLALHILLELCLDLTPR